MLKVFDIREAAGMTDVLVRDAERGRALVEVLGNEPAVLMRGHGVAIVGDSLPRAVGRSVYLELNARIQSQAIALGGDSTYLDPEEARLLMEGGEHRGVSCFASIAYRGAMTPPAGSRTTSLK